jgi:L,D-peptidoglycan transpeptidase YkuD (ErfK/YbiS/YcfS/YnhG family)
MKSRLFLLLGILAMLVPASADAASGVNPNGMRGLGGADQVIEIAASGMHARTRVAGDGTTPIGDYGFVFDFGSRPDPGVDGFEWRHLRPGDCWSGIRRSYNRWVERSPCASGDEDLWVSAGRAYRYAAVIDFNYRDPVFGRGSGIFLHVATESPTSGCVSLPERDLLGVLRWMRPGARILIGPTSWLRGLKPAG